MNTTHTARPATLRGRAGAALATVVLAGTTLTAMPLQASAVPDHAQGKGAAASEKKGGNGKGAEMREAKSKAGKAKGKAKAAAAHQDVDAFIVEYKDSAATATKNGRAKAWGKAAKEAGVSVKEYRQMALGQRVVKADKKLSPAESAEFAATLEADPNVVSVTPDVMLQPTALDPADEYYSNQWGFHSANGMNVPVAWSHNTGEGQVVAVLDTGITRHPDLDANLVRGYDFISNPETSRDYNGRDANPQDEGDWFYDGECGQMYGQASSWHGTHVAGTVAAAANTQGVVGVAPDAKIQPVRVLGKCGGNLSDIIDAIVWSAGGTVPGVPGNRTPADVINMSLGGRVSCLPAYQKGVDYAVSRGVPVVVAAGNDNKDALNYAPANCANTITVASSGPDGARSYFSNFGSAIDVTAPGGNLEFANGGILSTVNLGTERPGAAGYSEMQGTSMAAPHVAGLVALMQAETKQTPARVEASLKNTARPMPVYCSAGCGAGLVDSGAALSDVASR